MRDHDAPVSGKFGLGAMRATDVPKIAKLHCRAFPNFFLSELGEAFLATFYRSFLRDPTGVTVVARDEHANVVGAVVGTVEPCGFFKRVLRRKWYEFGFNGVRAVARNPRIAARLLRALTYRGGPSVGSGALLSSIFVDPDRQTDGVGRSLIAAWMSEAASRGSERAFLSTDAADNDRVNRFYGCAGWTLREQYATREGRSMNLYEVELPRSGRGDSCSLGLKG